MTNCLPDQIRSARTFLFVPGNRPERFDKAAAAGSDMVIVDLEDSVAPSEKTAAREHTRRWLKDGRAAVIRINGTDTPWHNADIELLTQLPFAAVMVPKTEKISPSLHGRAVIALVETAAGIASAAAVASIPEVHRLAFGSVDLAAQLGTDPADREALLFARSSLVLASAAAGLPPPIDGVTADMTDRGATTDDTRYARALGMTAKLCIHPAQVEPVHHALAPTSQDIEWARRIVAASDSGGGATAVDGQMVDLPVLRRAQAILARTEGASRTRCG